MPSAPLDHQIEAILFAASEPLTVAALAKAAGCSTGEALAALEVIRKRLNGGIRLAHTGGTYRLVSSPDAAATVGRFLEDTVRQDLSRPALETLAIVAYKGPLTKGDIEQIRGVASESMLRNLIARGLIVQSGRSTEPGRPPLYSVTHSFLQHFGLTDQAQLPPLPEEPDED